MSALTAVVLGVFVAYGASRYFGPVDGNFSLLLFLAAVVRGVYWVAERLYFLAQRYKAVAELEAAFHDAVDDYLAACKKLGQTPDKPYSGRVMLRLPPEVHARASAAAQVQGMSFNQWAAQVLDTAAQA